MKMRSGSLFRLLIVPLMVSSLLAGCAPENTQPDVVLSDPVESALPEPQLDGDVSVERSLSERRSVRDYSEEPLTLEAVSQLLWAAQGITDQRGLRTAPSAGGTYPLETYLVAGNVVDMSPGVYRYDPGAHQLSKVQDGDIRSELAGAALGQQFVADAAINIVFTAVFERTTRAYGGRGTQYVYMEVGHAAQNVYLQAVALDLGTVVIGAFHDDDVAELLGLSQDEQPLYIMPVGKL